MGGEAPKDFTKPQQTIQSPDRLYKAPTYYTKPPKDYRNLQKDYIKLLNIKQNPKILDKNPTHWTRVATNIYSTSSIKYPILNNTVINKKGIIINKGVN